MTSLIQPVHRASALGGLRRDEMVLNIDLAPTFLDYAAINIPSATQGKSLCALVNGAKQPWREDWFYEHHVSFGGKIPESEGVRTPRWKYIRYTSVTPVEELHDLRRDASEEHNLSKSLGATAQLPALRQRWMQLR